MSSRGLISAAALAFAFTGTIGCGGDDGSPAASGGAGGGAGSAGSPGTGGAPGIGGSAGSGGGTGGAAGGTGGAAGGTGGAAGGTGGAAGGTGGAAGGTGGAAGGTGGTGAWLDPVPAPEQVFYVSPNGTGDGKTRANPLNLPAAVAQSQPGHFYWLLEGTYEVGDLDFSEEGGPDRPLIYRAEEGAHVLFRGHVTLSASWVWLWGVEITARSPGAMDRDECLSQNGDGTHVINNVLHDCDNGILSSDRHSQIVYGNIIYNGHHNAYVQNSFDDNGYKYFVNNISFNADAIRGNAAGPYEFHAYGEGGSISGLWLEKNVFFNTNGGGEMLIGARNKTPNSNEVLRGNYFYKSSAHLGFARPVSFEFTGNYIARTFLQSEYFWGTGETRFSEQPLSVVEDNEIVLPEDGRHISFRTSAYRAGPFGDCSDPTCRDDGGPRIRAGERWDRNRYSTPFRAGFYAGGTDRFTQNNDFDTWKSLTAAAGAAFDANSEVVPAPSGQKVVLIPNEYEPGRAHLIIFNFAPSSGATAAVDLSPAVAAGRSYRITRVADAFGTPIASGTQSGASVSVPASAEFQAYLVTSRP
ncbi:MAG: hypothetical protein OZ921_21545 [Sorangiineae bacterium]|nr:hypothetical protein [Polyangiaceae bacterium]MEB2325113.1 hypothetical protein [Sorangiineae bacterium]